MLIGALALLYIYFPLIQAYFFPQQQTQQAIAQTEESYWIDIPSIHANSPIITNVDPWNEKEYKQALKQGVAQAKGTALPGKGKTYIFAHSSDYPWNITRYNTAFFKLHQLKENDVILIHSGKKTYTYKVTGTKEIWPTEVEYFKNQTADLILQTCTPIGTDLKRLLVFATLQK